MLRGHGGVQRGQLRVAGAKQAGRGLALALLLQKGVDEQVAVGAQRARAALRRRLVRAQAVLQPAERAALQLQRRHGLLRARHARRPGLCGPAFKECPGGAGPVRSPSCRAQLPLQPAGGMNLSKRASCT